jgi:opacity protein-like surface antigen
MQMARMRRAKLSPEHEEGTMSTSHQPARFSLRHAVTALGASGALALAALPAQAEAVPGIDFYVGGGIGQSNADISAPNFDEKDFGWKAFAGVRAVSYLGAELDYIDFGKPNSSVYSIKYKGLAGYGLFYIPIPLPVLDVYVKAGLARVDINPSNSISTNDTKFAFGGGLQLKFGSWAIRGEYEQYKVESGGGSVKPTLLSVGISKSFL